MWIISIHAPQWGATVLSLMSTTAALFQSTHPSGVRLVAIVWFPVFAVFQSTHPSGVRLVLQIGAFGHRVISIHAPQWGATGLCGFGSSWETDFNPRTPVGCDAGVRAIPFMGG